MSNVDLRLGDYRDVLADVECDALITDPPYGERTHAGHAAAVSSRAPGTSGAVGADGRIRQDIGFNAWNPGDVSTLVDVWAPRTRGWFVALTSHDLCKAYEEALLRHGRYVFAPLPCVIRGMTVRLGGDGPSSWAVWAMVARPRNTIFSNYGTLPGAYVVTPGSRQPGSRQLVGGKPLRLMLDIVRDYSRPGDLICDPCAGMATTGVAAAMLGRRFVGAEIDPDTHAQAVERLKAPKQKEMFA